MFSELPGGSDGKESACNSGDLGSIPGSEDPLEKEWLTTPVLLPGEFHGQRSLVCYRTWDQEESNTTCFQILSLLLIIHVA